MGDELIPAVDNVNTFDTLLDVTTAYRPLNDSTRHVFGEYMALGKLSDPVFGSTTADMYFNLSSASYGSSPFVNYDAVQGIDSVVLQLAYVGAYGDSSGSSSLTAQVAEIAKSNDFTDTTYYRYDLDGPPTGSSIGTKTFSVRQFKDTIAIINKPRDTTRFANVLRIPVSNSLGDRLARFDTANNGAFKNDSLFRTQFRGLAVKTTAVSGPGVLTYFDLSSAATQLVVYFRVRRDGVLDTTSAVFRHSVPSQINSIKRTPGGEYQANLNASAPQQLYIQSSPQGSYASLFANGLSNFPNKIIHRAELIAYRVPTTLDNIFTPPNRLFLDHKGASDTASFLFDNDIQSAGDGSFNLSLFGGTLRSDNSYRFNITRYVQGIVTRKDPNDTLRIYAPLRTFVYSKLFNQRVNIPVLSVIANGRVTLAGAAYPDPAKRIRLRIVYSNL